MELNVKIFLFKNLIIFFMSKITACFNYLRLIYLFFHSFVWNSFQIIYIFRWILIVRRIERSLNIPVFIFKYFLVTLIFFIILQTCIELDIWWVSQWIYAIFRLIIVDLLTLFQSISYHWNCFVSKWTGLLLWIFILRHAKLLFSVLFLEILFDADWVH